MKPLLTIAIPTITERAQMLDQLLLRFNALSNRVDMSLQKFTTVENILGADTKMLVCEYGDVNILALSDQKGQNNIGKKRNALNQLATGAFVAHFDDDDEPTDDYIRSILTALRHCENSGAEVHCCSLKGVMTTNGENPEIFEHSLRYKEWRTADYHEHVRYQRTINHLNPIRTDIAKQIEFPELNHGEDHEYSRRLMASGKITKQIFIPETLYHYKFVPNK